MNDSNWYDYGQQKAIALPPVGTECEFNHPEFNRFIPCQIVGHFGVDAVCAPNGGNYFGGHSDAFRPLDHATRAKELEREKFVEFVTDVLYKQCCATKGELRGGAEKLFEIGFRLPENCNE